MKTEDVIFKGTRQGLCVILPHDGDVERLKRKLASKLESTSGFFAGATRAILDIGELALSEEDVRALVAIVESFGISVSRVAGGVGLATIGRDHAGANAPASMSAGAGAELSANPNQGVSEKTDGDLGVRADRREGPRDQGGVGAGAGAGLAATRPPTPSETLLVRRTLRSGQRIAFGGNVVVLGDVNPGAEVVAGGDIVVVGALRGLAHAGTPANRGAVVVALRFTPTQLRIADAIARPPDGEHKAPRSPEMARIVEDGIVIEAYSARKAEQEEELAWEAK